MADITQWPPPSGLDFSSLAGRLTTLESAPGTRNFVRNGDMSVAQRGPGPFAVALSTPIYTLDGWSAVSVTNGTMSVSQVASTPGDPISGAYFIRSVIAGQSGLAQAYITQSIEGIRALGGKTVTVSFLARALTGTPSVTVYSQQSPGAGSSGRPTQPGPQTVAITTSWVRYSLSFVMPSLTGVVFGTASDDVQTLVLYVSDGSSMGIQNNTIDFADVQLEIGTVATPFEILPQEAQLSWNQRYYYRLTSLGSASWLISMGLASSTTAQFAPIPFPVTMRVPPLSGSVSGATHFSAGSSSGGAIQSTAASVLLTQCTTAVGRLTLTVASGLAAGNSSPTYFNSGFSGWVDFSSEL
jgi:hypothetical protein